jgi:myo-inositol 2-dehydrogenase / D-chiro-inositol 1-dehydrogenase
MNNSDSNNGNNSSRRKFLKTSAAALAGGIASRFGAVPAVYAAGSDEIRIGLIGCGSRGTGAVDNALESSENVKLVAMGDVFKDHLDKCLKYLGKFGTDKIAVAEDHQFVGLDAYEKVLASDANYIILATPPGFRPIHLKAAVAAGKNIFSEKPVAVDGAGIRTVLEAYEEANRKGLAIGTGTQRRHQTGYLETMKRIHDGAIGEITEARVYWNQGNIWVYPREEGWGDLEWQLRNWYYFSWICGDHIVEQHVHNLDVANWAIGSHPARAVGLGGRQVRTAPEYGNIYDHFAIDYEYENGAHVASYCRQMPNCQNNVSEALIGTQGFCQVNKYTISGKNSWQLEGKDNKPYVQEHTDLIGAIRAGKPYNELKNVAESTLTAIMGRMAAYTGQTVTWEDALGSKEELMPSNLGWDTPLAVGPVPMPGKTELV